MLEYKQSVAAFVPVRIFDAAGAPQGGIPFGSVTAAVQKSDGTTAVVTVTITDWSEVTTGAFTGSGVYLLKLPASVMNLTGLLTYAVATPGNKTHIGAIKIVANEEVDTYTRLGAPAGASIAADVATVNTSVGTVNTNVLSLIAGQGTILAAVQLLQKYEEGRWKIHITGADANRLVLYDTDNVTPLLKFDLKDSGGSATFINPFERYPVP